MRDQDLKPSKGAISRRVLISAAGIAPTGIAAAPLAQAEGAAPVSDAKADNGQAVWSVVGVRLNVNGQDHALRLDPRTTLLDCLREHLDLTGTKKGCDHGQCGACTVHVNGRRVNACLSFAVMHQGDAITTIEGLGGPGNLHPMQAAFVSCDGYQCGYCTPGRIMSATALLHEPCGPDDGDVKEAMSGNICRCGAYANIVEAIQAVRGSGEGAQL